MHSQTYTLHTHKHKDTLIFEKHRSTHAHIYLYTLGHTQTHKYKHTQLIRHIDIYRQLITYTDKQMLTHTHTHT